MLSWRQSKVSAVTLFSAARWMVTSGWATRSCVASHGQLFTVPMCPMWSRVQTDDNNEFHLDTMFQDLTKVKDPALEDVIMCPFELPSNPVSRPSNTSIFGGWGYTKEEYPKDVLPECCSGWMTRYSPKVAGELAQVGLELYGKTGAAHGDFIPMESLFKIALGKGLF